MNFIIYSKEDCPYCKKIKEVLKLAECNHLVYSLDKDFTREEFYSKFGQGSTFPQVIYNEKKLGGCVDTIKFLREQQII